MAVRGCGFCGFQIRYHGEPEGNVPVQHIFCHLNDWRELEVENLTADWLEMEHEEKFIYAWRCPRCGTFIFFNYLLKNIGTYVQSENFSSALMQEPFEFGPFWNDFQWFNITESNDNFTSEVLTKFPSNRWLAKNENELRIYEDISKTKCIAQYKRFQIPTKITVASMSLESFKKMLADYDDEIDFFYHKMSYEIIKEKLVGRKIKIIVNRDFDNPQCKYSIEVDEDENFADDLVNAKIFDDGNSIVQVQDEVDL